MRHLHAGLTALFLSAAGNVTGAPPPWLVLPREAVARATAEPEEVRFVSTAKRIISTNVSARYRLELRDESGSIGPVLLEVQIGSNSPIRESQEEDIRSQARMHGATAVQIDGSWFELTHDVPDTASSPRDELYYRGDRRGLSWSFDVAYDSTAVSAERVRAIVEGAHLDDAAATDVLARLDALAVRAVSPAGFGSNLGTAALPTTGYYLRDLRATGAPWSGAYEFVFERDNGKQVLALACVVPDAGPGSDRASVEQALLRQGGVEEPGSPTPREALHHYRYERRFLRGEPVPEEAWAAWRGERLLVAKARGLDAADTATLAAHLGNPDTSCTPMPLHQ
jgi:hypothetical protein